MELNDYLLIFLFIGTAIFCYLGGYRHGYYKGYLSAKVIVMVMDANFQNLLEICRENNNANS